MQTISELQNQIRNFINRPRRHVALSENPELFSQLCSSLDVIGDTDEALYEYLEKEQATPNQGERYLLTYGVLQALILQQDAVQHLAESLGVPYKRDTKLGEIREIRNKATGHPTRRGRQCERTFHHISRASMNRKGFDLFTSRPPNCLPERCSVDLISLIESQCRLLTEDLQRIVDAERSSESEHRRRHRDAPLEAAFPRGFDYTVQKLREEIAGISPLGDGTRLAAEVHKTIEGLRVHLTDRGELPALEQVYEYHARPALHSLERIGSFLKEGPNEWLTQADAENHLFRLEAELNKLRKLAREIDAEYQRDP